MACVRMMQVSIDEVIDMVAVRHRGMATALTMNVRRIMTRAMMLRRTFRWIRGRNLE